MIAEQDTSGIDKKKFNFSIELESFRRTSEEMFLMTQELQKLFEEAISIRRDTWILKNELNTLARECGLQPIPE